MLNVKIDMTGLNKLANNLRSLEEKQPVSFKDLFTSEFLRKYTNFSSLEDMLAKSGFVVNSQDDFKKIPDVEWDKFILANSTFGSWQKMLQAAGAEWAKRKILN